MNVNLQIFQIVEVCECILMNVVDAITSHVSAKRNKKKNYGENQFAQNYKIVNLQCLKIFQAEKRILQYTLNLVVR